MYYEGFAPYVAVWKRRQQAQKKIAALRIHGRAPALCVRRMGREVCVLATRMPMRLFRAKLVG